MYAGPWWFCCGCKPINIVVSEPIQSLSVSTWVAHGDHRDDLDDHYDADTWIMYAIDLR